MKILIDKYIPYLDGVLDDYATVMFLAPDEFTPERVRDADALVVRTRTQINKDLLEGSQVRMVVTATIGYDHIDTDYCREQHIAWTNCPGCNAQAVCDYVEEALTDSLIDRFIDSPIFQLTVGVVGVGHVGTKVAAMAEKKGFRVLRNDPPKGIGVSLDEVAAQADIITFHTPLDSTTYHLCDADFLAKCKPNALIINAARGGIVDEQALLNSRHPYIIDCWENEPNISSEVLCNERCRLASYHIAGYSVEGKHNASQMCLDALCRFFQLPPLRCQAPVLPPPPTAGWLANITKQLKSAPDQFEQLRKAYPLR
ncbi:MAG: 4-phosphoerythronate dehydrogenase [Paludibacteraceae bacterium]|nr:4-phosphoerythronate dehydrogenase [Paludibacteraceae bacterium]